MGFALSFIHDVEDAAQDVAHNVTSGVSGLAHTVANAPLGEGVKYATGAITGNQQAEDNAAKGLKLSFLDVANNLHNAATPTFDKNGHEQANPALGNFAMGAEGGLSEGGAAESAAADATSASKQLFTKDQLDKLAKTDDQQKIIQQTKDQIGEPAATHAAPAIATAKDPNIITNILDNQLKSKLTPPSQAISDITPSPAPVDDAALTEAGAKSGGKAGEEQGPPSPAAQQVIDNLKSAQEQRDTLAQSDTAERSARLGAAQAVGADKPGLEGHYAELGQLKGEFSKPGYLGLSNNLDKEGLDQLYTQLRQEVNDRPDVQGYQRINVNEALRKVVYGDERPPQPGEIKLLKNVFGDDFGDTVQKSTDEFQNKSSLGEKAFGVWRAGLLTGTHILPKVALSHAVQGAAETASQAVGAGVDNLVSKLGFSTGGRALTMTGKGLGEGFKEGAGKAGTLLKTGEDSGIGTNSQADFGQTVNYGDSMPGKFLNAYVNGVGRIHGAIYKPFSEAKFANSLYDQATAEVKNLGLTGEDADKHIADFVHQPSEQAAMTAEKDAREFAFQQETQLGKIASTIQDKGGILGKALVPFSKIPSAIATDLFHYSPAGAMKTIYDGIKAAKTEEGWSVADQRAFDKGLGRSIVGTAAIVPGIMLYNKGMMTLGYPSDPKEQALWQDEGKIPNAVKIGGKWESLGSLGPMGSVLSIGGHMADSLVQGKDIGTAMMTGFAGGLQSIQEQSYLQGVNQASTALSDPSKAQGVVKNYAGSVVPSFFGNIASATDQVARQTTGNNPLQTAEQSVENRIPGLREKLPAQVDVFGNPLVNGKKGLLDTVDPGYGSKAAIPGPLLEELRRLQNTGYGTMPSVVPKKENFGTASQPMTATLNQTQRTQLQMMVGQATENLWAQTIQDPTYQQAGDDQKQTILKGLYDNSLSQAKAALAQYYKLGPYSPDPQKVEQQSKQKRVNVV